MPLRVPPGALGIFYRATAWCRLRNLLLRERDLTVLLLDGYNLLYRAFTSLPSAIVGSDGRPINAVYGLLTSLLRYMRETQSDRMVLALDSPDVPTFRHERYPAYQGHRGPLGGDNAPDFARQVRIAADVAPGLGIVTLSQPGFEADDIMGSCGVKLADSGEMALVVSTDRDLLQLVRPGIDVLSPGNPPIRAHAASDVIDRLGVPPEGITTYKALAGDASDNIPGVKGIGAKTAVSLVTQYGSLEEIYAHLDDLAPATRQKLEAGLSDAFLFRDVVTVVTSLDIPLDTICSSHVSFGPEDKARDLLKRFGYG